jgi:transposase
MMFLRKRKSKKGFCIDILTAFRNKHGKPTNKQVGAIGPFISFDDEKLEELTLRLLALSHPEGILLDESVCEVERRVFGTPMVVGRLFNELGIDKVLRRVAKQHEQLEFDLERAVLLTIIQRFIEPSSKLATFKQKEKIEGDYAIELQHLYRSLDLLSEHKEDVEESLFDSRRDLFNSRVDVVFFDTTTFYFDSQRETELLRKGFSKDGKFSDVQIVYGLMTDRLGQPIGYEYFPGNTADVKTLLPTIKALKKRFRLGDVTLVADSGVLSKDNLTKLDGMDYKYIVAARLLNLPRKKQDEIFDSSRYKKLREGDDELLLYETVHENRRLIVTWSKKRAQMDAKEREKLIEKLKKRLDGGKKNVLANRYRKFVELGDSEPVISEKALSEASKSDGYLGILTNNRDLQGETLLEKYKELWRIEESFRLMKSQLEVRPMFHWTERRISGHLVMCFLAFVVLRELERRVKDLGIEDSVNKILTALSELQVSELLCKGDQYLLRSRVSPLAESIFKALKIKLPPSFQPIVHDEKR